MNTKLQTFRTPFILPIINYNFNYNETKEILLEKTLDNLNQKKHSKYGFGNEAKSIKMELGNFDNINSEAYKEIIKQFGPSIRFSELLGIINSLQIYLKLKKNIDLPKTTRNEKRNFQLLIKYIDTNSELIFPYLKFISLCNSSFQKIELDSI